MPDKFAFAVRIETLVGPIIKVDVLLLTPYTTRSFLPNGQVAQLVERGPEKAGVGGSIPSLATINFNNLARLKKHLRISRANNTRTSVSEIASHVGSTRRACRCLITLRDAPANSRHAQPSFLDGSDLVLPLQRT